MQLRPDQKRAVDFALNAGNNVALLAPTASGKGHMGEAIARLSGKRTAIITWSNELLRQFRETFPYPYVIGKSNYETTRDYMKAVIDSATAQVVLFNPASYVNYVKNKLGPEFDMAVIDEADSCLGLFALQTGSTVTYSGMNAVDVAESIAQEISPEEAKYFLENHHIFWWEETEVKKGKKTERKVTYRKTRLSRRFREFTLPRKVVAMSGTLFPSHCEELFGGGTYESFEIPSPIPVERRPIELYSPPEFDGTPDGLVRTLETLLGMREDRPVIAHVTYADVKEIQRYWDVKGYDSKALKIEAIKAIEGTDEVLFTPGATTGLDLKGDKARLNVILRGAYPNLGAHYVAKRMALPGGQEWYTSETLRLMIQASGRVCRTPDDYGRTIVADTRLVRLIRSNLAMLPKYFLEALKI